MPCMASGAKEDGVADGQLIPNAKSKFIPAGVSVGIIPEYVKERSLQDNLLRVFRCQNVDSQCAHPTYRLLSHPALEVLSRHRSQR